MLQNTTVTHNLLFWNKIKKRSLERKHILLYIFPIIFFYTRSKYGFARYILTLASQKAFRLAKNTHTMLANKSIIKFKMCLQHHCLRHVSVGEVISELLHAQELQFIQEKHFFFLRRHKLGSFGTNSLELLGTTMFHVSFTAFKYS